MIRSAEPSSPLSLVHVAKWEEGLAVSSASKIQSVRGLLAKSLRWVGREEGAGARRCQDELLGSRPVPRQLASSHWGVAEAVKSGWADVGVCQRLAAEEREVGFVPICQEIYDLCYRAEDDAEPRIAALLRVLRSTEYRKLLQELPGYACHAIGEVESV
jgi:molybdate-binding protein